MVCQIESNLERNRTEGTVKSVAEGADIETNSEFELASASALRSQDRLHPRIADAAIKGR